jgi:Na+/proline symporter
MELDALDWSIVVGYFVLTLGVGLAFSSRAGRSVSEYFVSGRSMPWWLAGTSMVATTFAADTPLAVTGLIAKYGLAGNWFWWAYALGGMFTVFVYARLWRRAEVLTDVQLLELRYGGRPAAALRAVRALYVAMVVNPFIIGWVTGAMVLILKETVLYRPGREPIWGDWGIIAALLATVGLYCTLSGLWGVAVTDFLQFFLAMGGCIALAIMAVRHVGGMEALQQRVIENFGDGHQAFGFLPDFSAADPWLPWNMFCVYLFVQWWATWYPGAEPGGGGYIVQRMASCKDERHSLLATLWFQLAHYCVRPWPWFLVAFAALAMYPEIRQLGLGQQVAGWEDRSPNVGYVLVMREVSPSGLRGLILVTFFAAFMSTISTQINWGASYLVCDIYQRFIAQDASERHLTRVSRIVSVFVLISGGVAAYLMRNIPVDEAWKMLAAFGAGIGAVLMLRWFWWRVNAWTEIMAMGASLVYYSLFVKCVAVLAEHRKLGMIDQGGWQDWLAREGSRAEVQTLVVTALTLISCLATTYLTPAESPHVLEAFYRKVRPGGPGWGPIARRAPDVESDRHLGLSIVASFLGATMIYLTLPAVGWLLFGTYVQAALALAAAAVNGLVIYTLLKRIGWAKIAS